MGKEYDGKLISDLGVERYLAANKSLAFSNINMLITDAEAEKAWKTCNFGCHAPGYRRAKRQATSAEMMQPIEEISPLLAGAIEGAWAKTGGQVEGVLRGARRTAEGLHAAGDEAFRNVGDENWAVYEFCKSTLENVFKFDIDSLDNPICQSVMAIVTEYMLVLPEWVIEQLHQTGALQFVREIDKSWLMKAAAIGLIAGVKTEDLNLAVDTVNIPGSKFVGKQIGKKVAAAIAVIIASEITKNLLKQSNEVGQLKRKLVNIRRGARTMKGGLGSALLILLKSQGLLDKAAQASRKLEISNPRIWRLMRYNLRGTNMIYFLFEVLIQEYLDRLSLLEKNPAEFLKVMKALIKDKKTENIIFAYKH